MQISANNLLQVAQQALAPKQAVLKQPATQGFEPMSITPEPAETPPASAAPAKFVPPGSQVDIKI